jgi:hypothetical protein
MSAGATHSPFGKSLIRSAFRRTFQGADLPASPRAQLQVQVLNHKQSQRWHALPRAQRRQRATLDGGADRGAGTRGIADACAASARTKPTRGRDAQAPSANTCSGKQAQRSALRARIIFKSSGARDHARAVQGFRRAAGRKEFRLRRLVAGFPLCP